MELKGYTAGQIRKKIKTRLALCKLEERIMFCRMYAPEEYQLNKDPFLYNIEKLAKYNVNSVVEMVPDARLNWALMQVENTLKKRGVLKNVHSW